MREKEVLKLYLAILVARIETYSSGDPTRPMLSVLRTERALVENALDAMSCGDDLTEAQANLLKDIEKVV